MAKDTIYLTVGKNPKGPGLLAIITQGHLQDGDAHCTVLTVELVTNMKAARTWFSRMKIERPWEISQ